MDTNAFTLNVQLYMGHVTWLSMVFFSRELVLGLALFIQFCVKMGTKYGQHI